MTQTTAQPDPPGTPDPLASRRSPHSVGHRLARFLWGIVYVLFFRPTPRNFHFWRIMLLRMFGAQIHSTARIYPKAKIWAPWNLTMHEGATIGDDVDVYSVAPITLEAWAGVSAYCYLCAASHDFDDVEFPLTPAPIKLGRRCWLAADVFVAPGVTIGDGVVVGARSSVFSDLLPWMVCMGTPAKPVRPRKIGPADFGEGEA